MSELEQPNRKMIDTWANKMWADIFEEMTNKGDALLDLYDSVCIVRLRQVVEWSLKEMREIKDRAEITEAMWDDYAELEADVLAAKRMLEYFGASVVESDQ
jgi:hypothetical protein